MAKIVVPPTLVNEPLPTRPAAYVPPVEVTLVLLNWPYGTLEQPLHEPPASTVPPFRFSVATVSLNPPRFTVPPAPIVIALVALKLFAAPAASTPPLTTVAPVYVFNPDRVSVEPAAFCVRPVGLTPSAMTPEKVDEASPLVRTAPAGPLLVTAPPPDRALTVWSKPPRSSVLDALTVSRTGGAERVFRAALQNVPPLTVVAPV